MGARDLRCLRRRALEWESKCLDRTGSHLCHWPAVWIQKSHVSPLAIGSLLSAKPCSVLFCFVGACLFLVLCFFFWVAWESKVLLGYGGRRWLCSRVIASILVNSWSNVLCLDFCGRTGRRCWILSSHKLPFNSWFYHFQVAWPWANYSIPFLFSSFLIRKIRIIISTFKDCCED